MPSHSFRTYDAEPSRASRTAVGVAPERLDQWELVELAAEGTFARVYRARPCTRGDDVTAAYAVKRIKPEWEHDAAAIKLVRREARVGRAIGNAHLVPVLDAALQHPPYYLVMPWLPGETLDVILQSGDWQRKASDALWIARQVTEALAALDAAGWTHSDVKPANIMISPDGHATLLDLGLARRPADEDYAVDRVVAGSPSYMAPETFVSSLRPDIRSDLFSLGVVLYEMLSGQVPYAGRDWESLAQAHRQQGIPDIRHHVRNLGAPVARLLEELLANQPLRRPQKPAELLARLTALEIEELFEETMNAER